MPIAEERALVAWDAAAKREHFVRTVTFAGARAADPNDPVQGPPPPIAFVVPTPSQPEIAEADEGVFTRLAELSAPQVVTEIRRPIEWFLLLRSRPASVEIAAVPSAHAVEELARAHVAGFDAVSLRADDPAALSRWLGEHGFAERPSTAAWLAPYVEKHWIVTAFRFAPSDADRSAALTSRALRLSFAAEQPFWPWREPSDAPLPAARATRAYVVTSERREGKTEDGHALGVTEFAGPVAASVLGDAAPGLAGTPWLTTWFDDSRVRSGGELLFPIAADRATYRRTVTTIVERPIPIPLDLIVPALLLFGVPLWLLLRSRRPA